MPDSEAKKAWIKANTIQATIKINRNQSADILDYYGGKVTSEDIRIALKEYMKNHPKEVYKMKQYRIKAEFWSAWGEEVNEDTIVDDKEIDRLASEWGMDREDLLRQVEEI